MLHEWLTADTMTAAEFESITQPLSRQAEAEGLTEMRELLDCAAAFLAGPVPWNADRLLACAEALDRVQRGWDSRSDEPTSVLRQVVSAASGLVHAASLQGLDAAARSILATYGTHMPAAYRTALHEVFLLRPGWGAGGSIAQQPCVRVCRTRDQFRDEMLRAHPGRGTLLHGGSVEAFHLAVTTPSADTPRVSAATPPRNRVIVLPPGFSDGAIVHELLHWCTHVDFESELARHDADASFTIDEGITEHLTRRVWTNDRSGSYDGEAEFIARQLAAGTVTGTELERAYFAGTGAKTVVKSLLATVPPRAWIEADALTAALRKWVTHNEPESPGRDNDG